MIGAESEKLQELTTINNQETATPENVNEPKQDPPLPANATKPGQSTALAEEKLSNEQPAKSPASDPHLSQTQLEVEKLKLEVRSLSY